MIQNPYDFKVTIASDAYEYWVKEGNLRMADRMYATWQRLDDKRMDWENAMAQTRLECLDAVLAYEKRVGLR